MKTTDFIVVFLMGWWSRQMWVWAKYQLDNLPSPREMRLEEDWQDDDFQW